jgi:ATP-dependent exoDNAse (exonuclease V) alpha subunit
LRLKGKLAGARLLRAPKAARKSKRLAQEGKSPPNDKVMQTENDYDKEVFNGDAKPPAQPPSARA